MGVGTNEDFVGGDGYYWGRGGSWGTRVGWLVAAKRVLFFSVYLISSIIMIVATIFSLSRGCCRVAGS